MTRKIPPIPAKEFFALAIGSTIFSLSEIALFFAGYTDININTLISFAFASMMAYGIFAIKDKVKLLKHGIAVLGAVLLAIPMGIALALVSIPILAFNLGKRLGLALIDFLLSISTLIGAFAEFVPVALGLIGVLLLNVAIVPVLATYFTIYGLIFSLSGSTAKIMLRHYNSFGDRMMKPIDKYLHIEIVVIFVVVGVGILVCTQILSSLQTYSSVSANDAAFAASGNGLTAMATVVSYLPVLLIVITILAIIFLLRTFFTGMGAYAAA